MRRLSAFCRTLPGATEDVKWGADLVFSVAKKMFCVFSIEGGKLERISFKVDDHRFLELTDRPQFIPAPYLARAHWVSVVDRKGLSPAQLEAMIERSHELVVAKLPRQARAALAAMRAKPSARAAVAGGRFSARLFKHPGPGGWHFALVPARHAPPATRAWGRTPVEATVDGTTWQTSVWRGKDGRTLLAVPKRVRGAKGHGDTVSVTIAHREEPSRARAGADQRPTARRG